MALSAVHHVALLVSDYQKSREFYVDKLGFHIVRENFRKERGDYKLDLELDGVCLLYTSCINDYLDSVFETAARDSPVCPWKRRKKSICIWY